MSYHSYMYIPYTFIHLDPLTSIFIQFTHVQFIHLCPLSFMFIHFHLLSLIFIHVIQIYGISSIFTSVIYFVLHNDLQSSSASAYSSAFSPKFIGATGRSGSCGQGATQLMTKLHHSQYTAPETFPKNSKGLFFHLDLHN